jgi:UPF0716 family protein affecting phage T7 exclusion
MDQIAQLVGAILILIAFAAAQRGSMSPHSLVYLVLNFVGGVVLAVVALITQNWGFLLLETFWSLVSGWGLVRLLRGLPPAAAQ